MLSFCKKGRGPIVSSPPTERFRRWPSGAPRFTGQPVCELSHEPGPTAHLLKHLGSGDQPAAVHVVRASRFPVAVVKPAKQENDRFWFMLIGK